MAAHNAEAIFKEIRSFRTGSGAQTSERLLENYCKKVLTSVEAVHFDYKTKRDNRNPELEEDDKKNLAKCISGFANSGGGVILWGIKEKPSIQLKPIAQIETFSKALLELGGQATDPAVQGLDGYYIPSDSDSTAGFAVVLVPESPLPPHRVLCRISGVQHHYYIRSGSDFAIATHSQLEDMFGRRPRPRLTIKKQKGDFPRIARDRSQWSISFDVVNEGRGLAKYVCLQFLYQKGMSSPLGGAGESMWRAHYEAHDPETGHQKITCELHPEKVIHPNMAVQFGGLQLSDFSPGEYIKLDCTLYCEGAAPIQTVVEGTLQP